MPVTALLGAMAAWLVPGLLLVAVYWLAAALRADPARRTPPTAVVTGGTTSDRRTAALSIRRWGLRTRAVGEHPKAAETVGVDVIRLRYLNVILGGIFAGLAGAWFTLDYGSSFQAGMTGGRGFIALAALIFGRWMPLGAFGAALLFAAAGSFSIAIRTVPPTGQLGDILTAIPDQFWSALPYIVTLVVLVTATVVARSSAQPAALGIPFRKDGGRS